MFTISIYVHLCKHGAYSGPCPKGQFGFPDVSDVVRTHAAAFNSLTLVESGFLASGALEIVFGSQVRIISGTRLRG